MRILRTPSSRWLAGIVLVVALLVVLSVVLALVGRRELSLYPEDTPEGVVQRYLLAVKEDDGKKAYGYLSSELQEHCTYRDFQKSTRVVEWDGMSLTLEGTDPLNGEVEVRVRVTREREFRPFSSGGYSHTARYILEQEGDAWRFSEPPWPLGWCPGLERGAIPPVPTSTEGD